MGRGNQSAWRGLVSRARNLNGMHPGRQEERNKRAKQGDLGHIARMGAGWGRDARLTTHRFYASFHTLNQASGVICKLAGCEWEKIYFMGKALIIAEKPSVASDIAKALGGFTKHEDYFESDRYVL